MKILLVFPKIPTTFWSFHNALRFISKKSSEPPLGLLTIAAMLPKKWDKKLIDMNVSTLLEKDIQWADYVFLTGMNVQRQSFEEVINQCNEFNTPVIAGGPMVSTEGNVFEGIDHYIMNEAEITLPLFLTDLEAGCAKPVYSSTEFPSLSETPSPQWDLLDMDKYASMSIQYSRGCPFDCEFCSITVLNGRKPRTKDRNQLLNELNMLYQQGWRGRVFIVDDNFIGNKRKLKEDILPALIKWQIDLNYPFHFMTETSINLADDDVLLNLMSKAGFNAAFIGIETVNPESLTECGKSQNKNRDLVKAIKKLQQNGFIVSGGFIVGFDKDPRNIFEQQIDFIQKSGIVTAMVGLLSAIPGTRLFHRLKAEKRILSDFEGNNMDGTLNFIPKMNSQSLINGYKSILMTIYSHKEYYERIKTFLKEYNPTFYKKSFPSKNEIVAFIRSLWILGIVEKGRRHFWSLILTSIIKHPSKFSLAVTMAIYGFHFRRVIETVQN
jgi:radical SAM superfamily enzyme YgiQ (UPF0313 family)